MFLLECLVWMQIHTERNPSPASCGVLTRSEEGKSEGKGDLLSRNYNLPPRGRLLLASTPTVRIVFCTCFPHGFSCAPARIMPQSFPKVQGGGSLILAWQIKNKNVLVIGGGEVQRQSSLSKAN